MAAHFLECCSGEIQKTDKNHRFDNRRRGHENSPPQSLWALRFFHCAPRKTGLVQTVPSKMATACFHFAKPGVGPWLRGTLRQVRYARHRNCRVPENNSERLILDLEGKLPKLRRSLRSLEFGRNAGVPRSKSPGKLPEFQTILASVSDWPDHQGGYRGGPCVEPPANRKSTGCNRSRSLGFLTSDSRQRKEFVSFPAHVPLSGLL